MKLTAESTVFNDEKMQNKFAELVVDADGIRTEVSKKVGNNEVISRINQSAESVSIDASKVNIDGVITAINNNTTTTIDGDKITTGTLLANAVKADSGTFNTANIPNLNASKITTGTINIGRIPTTARNDTYITDIDSQDGIIVKAVKGKTDGSDDTKKNYIKLNASGLDVYQEGNSVAKYGATARIGKQNKTHIQISDSEVAVYSLNGTKNVVSIGEYTTGSGRISIKGVNNGGLYLMPVGLETYGQTDADIVSLNSGYLRWGSTIVGRSYAQLSRIGSDNDISGVSISGSSSSFYFSVDGNLTADKNIRALNGNLEMATIYGSLRLTVSSTPRGGLYDISNDEWIICADYNADSSGIAMIPLAGERTGTAGNPLYVTSTGYLRRNTSSSRRYKKDISVLSDEDLNPVRLYDVDVKQFIYRDDYLDSNDQRYGKTIPGFIVEELKDIYPIAVTYEDGQPENWDARYLIPPMLKLIQDQKKQLDELQAKIERSA